MSMMQLYWQEVSRTRIMIDFLEMLSSPVSSYIQNCSIVNVSQKKKKIQEKTHTQLTGPLNYVTILP